jgi:hypothetical protein
MMTLVLAPSRPTSAAPMRARRPASRAGARSRSPARRRRWPAGSGSRPGSPRRRWPPSGRPGCRRGEDVHRAAQRLAREGLARQAGGQPHRRRGVDQVVLGVAVVRERRHAVADGKVLHPLPTASTTPQPSWPRPPGSVGNCIHSGPAQGVRFEAQTPQPSRRTRTWPWGTWLGPGSRPGRGRRSGRRRRSSAGRRWASPATPRHADGYRHAPAG